MHRKNLSKKAGKFKKYCCVPSCRWTEDSGKHLVAFPDGRSRTEERQRWIEAVNIYASAGQRLYCCEDHFVLSEDAENFIRVKLMGGRILIKPGVVPHRNLELGDETDSADPTLSHFLLGSVVPERSQLENFDVEIQDGETPDDEFVVEKTPLAVSPKPLVTRRKTRPPRTRTHDQYTYKIAALKRKQGECVVTKPGLFKRRKHRPRILRGSKKVAKESSDSDDIVVYTDEKEVIRIENDSPYIPEPENIVVDVDLTEITCPCSCVEEDADSLAHDNDPDDPESVGDEPFGYHFLTSESSVPEGADQPSKISSVNWIPPVDPTSNKDGVMHTYGTVDENGDIAPLIVVTEKPPNFIDVNELSEEEHCEMPSSSEDEFSAEESDNEETEEEDEFSRYSISDLLCDIEDIDRELCSRPKGEGLNR